MRTSTKCHDFCLTTCLASKCKDPFTMNRLRSDEEDGGFQPGG